MMSLYDQYSDQIYYLDNVHEAAAHTVKALYAAYKTQEHGVAQFTHLQYLSLSNLFFTWQDLSTLQQLQAFTALNTYNAISAPICQLLQHNAGLLELALDNIKLAEQDDLSGIHRFTQLQSLTLSQIALNNFPVDICKLTHLQELHLVNLGIATVPDAICQLKNLKKLNLSGNRLTAFPLALTQLPQLEELVLDDNPIGNIPREINQLKQLKRLSIANCRLTSLPPTLVELPVLKDITATGNQFDELPKALQKLGKKLKLELKYRALYDEAAQQKYAEIGQTPAIFSDFGFKLMVIQNLMYQNQTLTPKIDVAEFVKHHTARIIDIESEGYDMIPEVRAYFEQLPIPQALLQDIESLTADGGDDIYSQISPLWGGEDDFYLVKSAKDAKLLPNLKSVASLFLTASALKQFEKAGIAIED